MKTKSELLEELNKIEIKISSDEIQKIKKENITLLKDMVKNMVLVNHINVTFHRLSEIASEIGADDLLVHFVDYKTLENVVKNALETNGMSDVHNLLKRIDSLTYSVYWLDGYMISLEERGISGYARNVNLTDLERLKEKLRHRIEYQYKENKNKHIESNPDEFLVYKSVELDSGIGVINDHKDKWRYFLSEKEAIQYAEETAQRTNARYSDEYGCDGTNTLVVAKLDWITDEYYRYETYYCGEQFAKEYDGYPKRKHSKWYHKFKFTNEKD